MSLFSGQSAPQEDPAIKAQRDRQQRQADNQLTGEIQTDLQRRTRSRMQRFGLNPVPSNYSPQAGSGFSDSAGTVAGPSSRGHGVDAALKSGGLIPLFRTLGFL